MNLTTRHWTQQCNGMGIYARGRKRQRGRCDPSRFFFFSGWQEAKDAEAQKKKSSVQKTETDKDVVGMRKAFQSGETVGQF